MELICKHFSELTASELYEIYRLRVSVFVVEQNCAYQDVDEADRTPGISGCRTRAASPPTHACSPRGRCFRTSPSGA